MKQKSRVFKLKNIKFTKENRVFVLMYDFNIEL